MRIILYAVEAEYCGTENPEHPIYYLTEAEARAEYEQYGESCDEGDSDDLYACRLYSAIVTLPDGLSAADVCSLLNGGRVEVDQVLASHRCVACGDIITDPDEPNAFSELPQATDTTCADCVATEQDRIADDARERIHAEAPRAL